MLEERVIRCRSAKRFEERYLRKGFDEQISVIRILDSRREEFRLSKAYEQKIDVVNVITAPEIEMLDGCKRDPENRIWYAPWKMTLKNSQEFVGDLYFKDPVKNHVVEIGYGVQPEQEGHGYTTKALRAMTQWAFSQKDVVFVEAETAPDNKASQRVLEKCGFVPDGTTGKEGPRFVLERTLTNWVPISCRRTTQQFRKKATGKK